MNAPHRLIQWLGSRRHIDRTTGQEYYYHPRSDAHSIALCEFIIQDLIERSPFLRAQAERGHVAYGINLKFIFPTTGKQKTLDLAVGTPKGNVTIPSNSVIARVSALENLFIACEAKAVMTEHIKSKPRLFDELSSSHEIVHQADQETIAAGITMVNVASTYLSPTNQRNPAVRVLNEHRQPYAAASMIEHLRGLKIRSQPGEVGFDSYSTFVVDTDNVSYVQPYTSPPAPQEGDLDHYETFLDRIIQLYENRFIVLP